MDHEYIDREGDNLAMDLTIPVVHAILGKEESLNLFLGEVKVPIPSGTQTGDVIRMVGYGMPKTKGGSSDNERGDLFLRCQVSTPSLADLSEEEKELYEKLRDYSK